MPYRVDPKFAHALGKRLVELHPKLFGRTMAATRAAEQPAIQVTTKHFSNVEPLPYLINSEVSSVLQSQPALFTAPLEYHSTRFKPDSSEEHRNLDKICHIFGMSQKELFEKGCLYSVAGSIKKLLIVIRLFTNTKLRSTISNPASCNECATSTDL